MNAMYRCVCYFGMFVCFGLMSCVVGTPGSECHDDNDCNNGFCRNGFCISGCQNDKGCPAYHRCEKGLCIPNPCQTTADCKEGTACISGKCVNCTEDTQCGNGYVCANYVCRKGNCRGPEDQSCVSGQVCREYQCTPCQKHEECGKKRICRTGQCEVGCQDRSDCENRQVCDTSTNTCKECLQHVDCIDGKLCDPTDTKCKECLKNEDCRQGVCDKTSGTCKPCLQDTDCSTGQRCKNAQCTDCRADADCSTGQHCEAGRCNMPECQDSRDCKDGKICRNRRCETCNQDADCGTAQICEKGQCLRGQCQQDAHCTDGQICRLQRCSPCVQDSDCGAGSICDTQTHRCRSGCRNDQACTDNQKCLPQQNRCGCLQNNDCLTGQLCKQNVCSGCSQDQECSQGQLCINQRCKTANCRTNQDCQTGLACLQNLCTSCQQDRDCSTGQICDATKQTCRLGCRQDNDCQGQKCDPSDNMCKACLNQSHCPAGQSCINNQCVSCQTHADCAANQVCQQGQCVACPNVQLSMQGPQEEALGALIAQTVSIPTALVAPIQWRIASGAPTWLTLNTVSPHIVQLVGTATSEGDFKITVEASAGSCKYSMLIPLKIWPRLTSLVATFLKGTSSLNVAVLNQTFKGGKPPYRCQIYKGIGEGTQPSGVSVDTKDTTGCTLTGVPDQTNLPGSYGFMVSIYDSLNRTIEIPVSYIHKSCHDGTITLSPSVDQTPVFKAGSEYSWDVKLIDVDAYADQGQCVFQMYLLLKRGPLTSDASLSCGTADPICVECNATTQFCSTFASTTTCPTKVTIQHAIKVKKHTPFRTNVPGFLTLEPMYTYSVSKTKGCHWEVLETP